MKKGEIIDITKIGVREFNPQETLLQMSRLSEIAYRKFICWGATGFTVDKKTSQGLCTALKFKVNGMKHKGYVYIALNFADLYDVYFVSKSGEIIDKKTDIYFDQLNEIIDDRIEKVDDYKF